VGKPEIKKTTLKTQDYKEDNFKIYLQKVGWWTGTGLIWLRIGTGGEIL
jgi:hypothetical protein